MKTVLYIQIDTDFSDLGFDFCVYRHLLWGITTLIYWIKAGSSQPSSRMIGPILFSKCKVKCKPNLICMHSFLANVNGFESVILFMHMLPYLQVLLGMNMLSIFDSGIKVVENNHEVCYIPFWLHNIAVEEIQSMCVYSIPQRTSLISLFLKNVYMKLANFEISKILCC